MLQPRTSRRSAILLVFLASCVISLLSSVAFYAYFGRVAGAAFLRPDNLFGSVLSDGVGAVLLLAILWPLRSVGAGPFWACGTGVAVMLWPPLSDSVRVGLDHAAGQEASAHLPWSGPDFFYSLLHFPDNLVLVAGSLLLLACVARLGPVPLPAARPVVPHGIPTSALWRCTPPSVSEILFSFAGRLNRRPYIIATLAIGIPNTVLQGVVQTDLGLLLQILLFWPLLALATKRAHDRGHGSAWVVCMLGLPGAAGILLQLIAAAGKIGGPQDAATLDVIIALNLLIVLPVLWASVEFFFLRGTSGTNRFGPDPLSGGDARRFVPTPGNGGRRGAPLITPAARMFPQMAPGSAARFRGRFSRR